MLFQRSRDLSGTKLPPLAPGCRVWYKRPPRTGEKTDSRWIGPGVVLRREGLETYAVEVALGHVVCAPRHWLKEYVCEGEGPSLPLFYHRRTEVGDEEVTPTEWEVEKILRHRWNKKGFFEFLTVWKGFSVEEATWEPLGNFFHR